VLVVGLALAGGQLVLTALDGGDPKPGDDPTPEQSSTASASSIGDKLDVASVTTFDPEGDGEENQDEADRVVDGKASTVWISKYYKDPFGPTGLKDGVGLVLDLGTSRRIGAVKVRTVGGATDFEVRTSDQLGSSPDDFDPMGKPAQDVDGPATVRPEDPVRARYVLVWLTQLPVDGDVYRGRIAEIAVYGD
jgi:hypothetical protein